jgi:membrane protein YqaA with SNARE-associated domain
MKKFKWTLVLFIVSIFGYKVATWVANTLKMDFSDIIIDEDE